MPTPTPSLASIAQRARRERERQQREADGTHTRNRRVRAVLDGRPLARRPYRDDIPRVSFGAMNIRCPHCRALHWDAERRAQSSAAAPSFLLCCKHGKVRLPLERDPPPLLHQLLGGRHPRSAHFMENIRQYNLAFAFTSLGVTIRGETRSANLNEEPGPFVFKINGELCHRAGSLLPREGTQPSYAQLWIHDAQYATDVHHGQQRNAGLDSPLMHDLHNLLLTCHRYARVYRHAFEILSQENARHVAVALCVDPASDPRRYNLPITDEIAALLPGDETAPRDRREIVLRTRDGPLRRISDAHPAYACLQYVFLFPWGSGGWTWTLTMHEPDRAEPRRLTQCMFYSFQLQHREGVFNTILHGGRLFQQYVVDIWAAIDQNRLNFLRANQSTLCAELYSGLQDAVAAADSHPDLNNVGRRIILPSSYIGGPRYMYQCFQDGMALARYFRSIDLFITVTTNPNWPEIRNALLPGQEPKDRPDIVARVFALYRERILADVYKDGVFGRAVAHIHTIEFQKRGLPHMHLLIFLADEYKIRTAADVDSVVRAYLPDREREPRLYETVTRCMLHGPCGPEAPNAPCMRNGKCMKGFPKPFQDGTTMNAEGYPLYHRPDDGRTFEKHHKVFDNRSVVPYSPYLSARYDCHINVEAIVSFTATKYINKYSHKGPDRATAAIDVEDEITSFLDTRYISSIEAMWRTFENDIHRQSPNVVRLQVHLPGQHRVVFDAEEPVEAVMARASVECTMLTAFFAANAGPDAAEAQLCTYQEFPQKFVWQTKTKSWRPRQRDFALGRMYFITPSAGETFYLRTLLTVVRGPTSFQNLRTVNGVEHPDFYSACLALGLLEDDGEWRMCLFEAAEMQPGASLRRLFVVILTQCQPSRPGDLWAEFRQSICDDLPRALLRLGLANASADDVYDYGLFLVEQDLLKVGSSLDRFPSMPRPIRDWAVRSVNRLLAEQLDYDHEEEAAEALEMERLMNADQRSAYDRILAAVEDPDLQQRVFFTHGSGGVGKTFLYRVLCHRLRSRGLVVLCVASSGIASLLMPGGRTAHSTFQIPIEDIHDGSVCAFSKTSARAELIRRTALIIWDEAVMQHRHCVEAVSRSLSDVRDDERPFGGIAMVLGGDTKQVLPVVPHGTREDVVNASIMRSRLWPFVEVLHLATNMRLQREDGAGHFQTWLHGIGTGTAPQVGDERGLPLTRLPHETLVNTEAALIDAVYADIARTGRPPADPTYFLNRTILAPRNETVNALNDCILDRLPGDMTTFVSADSCEQEAGADDTSLGPLDLPPEFLHTLNPSGLPLAHLRVKVGAPLILLRNLAAADGLCNGTRMILRSHSARVLQVMLIGGERHGQLEFIPRITLTPMLSYAAVPFRLRRRQFPVRLAFTMSINKAQGQTVPYVGLDLHQPVFGHGQLYVALSRVTSHRNVHILLDDSRLPLSASENVVYPEVLL